MKDKRILYVSSEVVPYLLRMRSFMSYDVPKNDQGGRLEFAQIWKHQRENTSLK
jgi:hypothetical protein